MELISHEAFAAELAKIAEEEMNKSKKVKEIPLSYTPEGMPVPPKPGPRYMAHYIGDPLLSALGSSIGAGLGQFVAGKIKGGATTPQKEKILEVTRKVLPVVSSAASGLGTGMLLHLRRKRLLEAMDKDERARMRKEQT